MKTRFLLIALLGIFSVNLACGQMEDKSKRASPPATVKQKVGEATIVIDYSQPAVKERKIYGELVPYGKVWRTGANEATTFETDKDLMINGKKLPAGKYALFTIPGEDEWTIIFNSEAEQWGAFDYDKSKDVLRVKAKPVNNKHTERMTFFITKEGIIRLDWADKRVPFTVKT